MNAKVFKDGDLVAQLVGDVLQRVSLDLEGLPKMDLYGLPRMRLERRYLFEHLQGGPLSRWLNGSGLQIQPDEGDLEQVEPLFYVHGRSETMRGNVMISAVVLAHLHEDVDLPSFAVRLPEIYKRFAAAL